jgi:hypothetical protein
MTRDGADGHFGPGDERLERGQRVEPELPGADRQRFRWVGAVPSDIDGQAVEPGRMEEHDIRQGPVARRFPAMHERHPRPGSSSTCRDEPGR